MGFADEAERAMDVWFGPDMAPLVEYNGLGIRAHLEQVEDTDPRTGAVSKRAVLEVRKADVPNPAYRDLVVAAGVSWRVLDKAGGDEWSWTLNLIREERPTR